jgi:hypothetical protein
MLTKLLKKLFEIKKPSADTTNVTEALDTTDSLPIVPTIPLLTLLTSKHAKKNCGLYMTICQALTSMMQSN